MLYGHGIAAVSSHCEILRLHASITIARVGFSSICGLWINFLAQGEIIHYVAAKFNEMCRNGGVRDLERGDEMFA